MWKIEEHLEEQIKRTIKHTLCEALDFVYNKHKTMFYQLEKNVFLFQINSNEYVWVEKVN